MGRVRFDGSDALAETGSKSLNLPKDLFSGINLKALWHMSVRVDRLQIIDGSACPDHALLGDDDERSLRHNSAKGLCLSGGDVCEIAAHMQCAGGPRRRVGPRNPAVDGDVQLERRSPVAIPHKRDECGQATQLRPPSIT